MATVCGGRSVSCSSGGEARGSPLRFDFESAGNGYSCNAQWSLEGAEPEHETSKLVSAISAFRTLRAFRVGRTFGGVVTST